MENKEIEIKMHIKNSGEIEEIRRYLQKAAEEAGKDVQTIEMKAVYYDTESGILHKRRIAYRTRKENKCIVATYKSGKADKNGVFHRIEVNRKVGTLEPEISVFADDENVWEMLKGVENNELKPVITTDFIRECASVKRRGSEIEIALDIGNVAAKNAKAPICELELELKRGAQEELLFLKNELTELFDLEISTVSKYHKGLILAGLD